MFGQKKNLFSIKQKQNCVWDLQKQRKCHRVVPYREGFCNYFLGLNGEARALPYTMPPMQRQTNRGSVPPELSTVSLFCLDHTLALRNRVKNRGDYKSLARIWTADSPSTSTPINPCPFLSAKHLCLPCFMTSHLHLGYILVMSMTNTTRSISTIESAVIWRPFGMPKRVCIPLSTHGFRDGVGGGYFEEHNGSVW